MLLVPIFICIIYMSERTLKGALEEFHVKKDIIV